MLTTPSPSGARTFIVTVWFEGSDLAHQSEWRGEVRDPVSGSQAYFRGLDGVTEVLERLVDSDGGRSVENR